ncbi:hypothetical protein [Arthrobacter flavus]|uniref:Uncharacterized protein n=1 Tax=Arthrobacter flavus TaxID=95172 RepID=A0ABW4Q648_9MICC
MTTLIVFILVGGASLSTAVWLGLRGTKGGREFLRRAGEEDVQK